MKKMVFILGAALLILAAGFDQRAEALGLSNREVLAASSSIEEVYTVDEYLTYVRGADKKQLRNLKVVRDLGGGAVIVEHGTAQPTVNRRRGGSPVEVQKLSDNGSFSIKAASNSPRASAETYARVYALCRKSGGTPTFVIPRDSGGKVRLTEVRPVDAFEYILNSKDSDTVWFMACNADHRFVVEKNNRVITSGVDTADVFYDRGLEGVDYVNSSIDTAPDTSLASGAAGDNEAEAEFMERMAEEVVSLRTGFERHDFGARYTGRFMGRTGKGCYLAEIRKENKSAGAGRNSASDSLFKFKVCQEEVANAKETEPQRQGGGTVKSVYASVKTSSRNNR